MSKKAGKHFGDSIIYQLEKTAIYTRVKGAQFFNKLNIGITLDQHIALDAVSYNEGICQRDLSKLILKDRSNTGRILNILEEKGFIKRKIDTKQKRLVKKIYITSKGKKHLDSTRDVLIDAYFVTFEDISDEEFAVLKKTLEKMRNCLSKTTVLQI